MEKCIISEVPSGQKSDKGDVKEGVWRYEMLNWFYFITSLLNKAPILQPQLKYLHQQYKEELKRSRGTPDRQTRGPALGSAEVLQDEAEPFQRMTARTARARRVGFCPDRLLTDTQAQSHQDVEDQRLQEEHAKSCDRQRHQVHQRACGGPGQH